MNDLEGELVRLRAREPADADRLWEAVTDPDFRRLARLDHSAPPARHAFEDVRPDDGFLSFAIVSRADDRVVGLTGLDDHRVSDRAARFSIGLHPDAQGQGLGTDAVRVMLRFGFDRLNLRRLWLGVIDYNAAAVRAYEKAGFVDEGRLRDEVWRDGEWHDVIIMSVLQDEWSP